MLLKKINLLSIIQLKQLVLVLFFILLVFVIFNIPSAYYRLNNSSLLSYFMPFVVLILTLLLFALPGRRRTILSDIYVAFFGSFLILIMFGRFILTGIDLTYFDYDYRKYVYNLIIFFCFFLAGHKLFPHRILFYYALCLMLLLGISSIPLSFSLGLIPSINESTIADIPYVIRTAKERLSGLYINPNNAGFFCSICMVLTLSFAVTLRKWYLQILFILLSIFTLGVCFITFSKTGILINIILCVLAFILILNRTLKGKQSRFLLFYIVILVGGFASAFSGRITEDLLTDDQFNRIEQLKSVLFEWRLDEETTTNRTAATKVALDLISERPILGHGYKSFRLFSQQEERINENIGVHNTYLLLWGESGILPFLLFLLFLISCYYFALVNTSGQDKYFCIGILIVITLYAFTTHNIFDDMTSSALFGLLSSFIIIQPPR